MLGRISGPLLDHIDIRPRVPQVKFAQICALAPGGSHRRRFAPA